MLGTFILWHLLSVIGQVGVATWQRVFNRLFLYSCQLSWSLDTQREQEKKMRARLFLLALVASFGYFTFGLAVAWPAAALPSIRFDPSHLYITSSRFLTSMLLAPLGAHNMYAYHCIPMRQYLWQEECQSTHFPRHPCSFILLIYFIPSIHFLMMLQNPWIHIHDLDSQLIHNCPSWRLSTTELRSTWPWSNSRGSDPLPALAASWEVLWAGSSQKVLELVVVFSSPRSSPALAGFSSS